MPSTTASTMIRSGVSRIASASASSRSSATDQTAVRTKRLYSRRAGRALDPSPEWTAEPSSHVTEASRPQRIQHGAADVPARLIWNDLFVKPRSFDRGLAVAEQVSACSHRVHPTTWWARCPGAPKAPPAGREALDAGSVACGLDASVRGPRRRRTLEGASTTSHADIRWLPRSPAAEHT